MDDSPALLLAVRALRMGTRHEAATLLLRLTPATCHALLARADTALDMEPHHPPAAGVTIRDATPTILRPRHQWPSPTPPSTRVLLDADCLPRPLPALPPGATIGETTLAVRRLPGSIDRHLSWSGSAHSIDLPWLDRGVLGGWSTRSEQLPVALVFEALLGGLPVADMSAVIEQYTERFALSLLSALETLAAAPADRPNPLHPVSPSPNVLLPLLQFPGRRVRERAQLLLARFRRPAPDPAARPASPVPPGPVRRTR